VRRVFSFLRDWFGKRCEEKPSIVSREIPTPALLERGRVAVNRYARRSQRHYKTHDAHLTKKKDGRWVHDGRWVNELRPSKAFRRIAAHP